jgi:hypothetical protein
MIPNNVVKAAIVAETKLVPNLVSGSATTSLPDGTQGIRETNWRGDEFHYPNVRISLENQTDATPDSNCTPVFQDWSIYVFSEVHSSYQCDEIAGMIVVYFKGRNFSSNGVKFVRVEILENIPAIQEDPNTWRAQIRCRSIVHEL